MRSWEELGVHVVLTTVNTLITMFTVGVHAL